MMQHELPSAAGPVSRALGSSPVTAYLGLGSNQGDRPAMLQEALTRLEASRRVRVRKQSSLYEPPLWGSPNSVVPQPRRGGGHGFAAAAAAGSRAGRRTGPRPGADAAVGPRTIDIDILLYADLAMTTPTLVIPIQR